MTADVDLTGRVVEDTEVLIVGAGPAGLMLANLLGIYGRRALVVEALPSLIDYPRAVGMDDESLRLVQTVGLSRQILPLTGPSHIMRLVNARGKVLLYNDPRVHPFGWPRKNAFNQPLVDAELARGLHRFAHVEIRFGHLVEEVREDSDGIIALAQVTEPDGATSERTIRSRFLVGCEGGRSATRKRMGVSFDGLSPSTRWLVVDVANDPLGTPNVWLGADRRRPYVSIGLPQAVRRFEFRLRDDEPDNVVEDPSWVAEMLADHVPDPTAVTIIRARVYTHHGRVAGDFRVGRQMIAGDAAHLMPVWLGQGWNSGVRDAMNLGWKLATVLAGQAPDSLLDTYTQERQGHATAMVKLSMTMGHIIGMRNRVAVWMRDLVGRILMRSARARIYVGEMRFRPLPRYTRGVLADQDTLTPGLSRATVSARSIPHLQAVDHRSVVGMQFPQPRVTTAVASDVRLDDAVGTWWALITWMNDPCAVLSPTTIKLLEALGARLVTVAPECQRIWAQEHHDPRVTIIGDSTGAMKEWFDTRPVGMVLLRPDHFVAGACLAQEGDRMVQAVTESMGFTGTAYTSATSVEVNTARSTHV